MAPALFGQGEILTSEIKQQTINDLAALLPERYAYKDLGPKLQQLLLENLKSGKYAAIASPLEFSVAVTNDLRSLQSDRHLALNYSPETPTPMPASTPQPLTPEERARRTSVFNRQMNFGFKNVQFLYGNIGYLKFDYFDDYLDYSGPTADASMAFFKNSDALIIDLRENGGGAPQMVEYIEGFFFEKRTLSGTSYDRLTDTTTERFIDPQPKEKRLSGVNLYILTSKNTVSAAEALAYDLKYLRNAIVIGETSAGAANPGRITRLNSLFTAFIPNRHGMNAVTKTNWEGTGVPVDITCPAGDALRVAKVEALKKQLQKATDPLDIKKFSNYVTFLEKTFPEKELPEKEMRQYIGEYQGGRTISLKNGKLFYSHFAEAGGQMHFISPDLFMLSEGDVTLAFKRDKRNRVVEMDSQWSLRSSTTNAKKIK